MNNKIIAYLSLCVAVGLFFLAVTHLSIRKLPINSNSASQTQLEISSTTPPTNASSTSESQQQSQTHTNPTPAENASQPIVISTPRPATTTPQQQAVDFSTINTAARPAVVNIVCTTKDLGPIDPITATGVIIDPRGVVLTNAHVGQYWLLQNFQEQDFVTCNIRTGSPAQSEYHAELLYISPKWVNKNKDLLAEINPQGTGEDDFALLRITDSINDPPLPTTFPYLPPDTRETIAVNEQVDLISYPAGFLGGQSILHDLDLTSALTNIQSVFTFATDTVDLISVGGTVISQKGASGGAVVDKDTTLIGLISTETDATTTAKRDLRAITLAHINHTLQNETGYTLSQFLSQDLAAYAHEFQKVIAPNLSAIIENELLK